MEPTVIESALYGVGAVRRPEKDRHDELEMVKGKKDVAVFRLAYVRSSDVEDELKLLFADQTSVVISDVDSHTLYVEAEPGILDWARRYIKMRDVNKGQSSYYLQRPITEQELSEMVMKDILSASIVNDGTTITFLDNDEITQRLRVLLQKKQLLKSASVAYTE
jgi:hypothetical protein